MTGTVWNLVLGGTTIIGFALAIWQTLRAEQLNRQQRDFDWPKFRNAASDLADEVDRSGYSPDLILAMSDRGAMVAYLVNRNLSRDVPVITAGYHATSNTELRLPDHFSITSEFTMLIPKSISSLSDKRILIVDDFVRSGDTIVRVKDLLISIGFAPENLKSATIVTTHVARANRKSPDFYVEEVESMKFYFPWGRAR